MTTYQLKIVGDHKMNCGGCENNVQMNLRRIPGVVDVQADHKTQLVAVSADNEIKFESMQDMLQSIGYMAELA